MNRRTTEQDIQRILREQFDAGRVRREAVRTVRWVTHLRLYPDSMKRDCLCGQKVKGTAVKYANTVCNECFAVFHSTLEQWMDDRTRGLSLKDAPDEVIRLKFMVITRPTQWSGVEYLQR